MRRTFVVLAIAMVAFSALAASSAAQASTRWPATCTSFKCVNGHLNDLNKRTKALKTRLIQDEQFFSEATLCEGDALVSEMQGDPDQTTGITGAVDPIAATLGVDCNGNFWPVFDPSLYGAASTIGRAPANSQVSFRVSLLERVLR
jgi:hypothetical protein